MKRAKSEREIVRRPIHECRLRHKCNRMISLELLAKPARRHINAVWPTWPGEGRKPPSPQGLIVSGELCGNFMIYYS
jgi:hypothetical protein